MLTDACLIGLMAASAVPVDFKLLRDRVQLVTSAQSLARAMPIPTHSQPDSELPGGGAALGNVA